jgi:hypothetical protein
MKFGGEIEQGLGINCGIWFNLVGGQSTKKHLISINMVTNVRTKIIVTGHVTISNTP